jgi:hypothetical protein
LFVVFLFVCISAGNMFVIFMLKNIGTEHYGTGFLLRNCWLKTILTLEFRILLYILNTDNSDCGHSGRHTVKLPDGHNVLEGDPVMIRMKRVRNVMLYCRRNVTVMWLLGKDGHST